MKKGIHWQRQATRLEKGEGKGNDDTMGSGWSKEGREKRSVSKKGFDRELVHNLVKEKEQEITKKRGAIGSRKGGRSGQSLKKALTENWLTTCSTSSKKAISRH